MPTFRPFSYNPSREPIPGTVQSGDIAIGKDRLPYWLQPGGIKWFGGPDEEPGYIIAIAVPERNYPTSDGLNDASVRFWRSTEKTDSSFVETATVVSNEIHDPQQFSSSESAKSWLLEKGLWTTWGEDWEYAGKNDC